MLQEVGTVLAAAGAVDEEPLVQPWTAPEGAETSLATLWETGPITVVKVLLSVAAQTNSV